MEGVNVNVIITQSFALEHVICLYDCNFKAVSLLWWDYSEGGSKCQAHCLNFDRCKIVVKISCEFPYKEIHVIF